MSFLRAGRCRGEGMFSESRVRRGFVSRRGRAGFQDSGVQSLGMHGVEDEKLSRHS